MSESGPTGEHGTTLEYTSGLQRDRRPCAWLEKGRAANTGLKQTGGKYRSETRLKGWAEMARLRQIDGYKCGTLKLLL